MLAQALTLTGSLFLNAGSVIAAESALANGSTLGGQVVLKYDETVLPDEEFQLAAGSVVASPQKLILC